MKTIAVVLVCLLGYVYCAHAQHPLYTVKPGEDVNAKLADSVKFHYPTFTQGTVFFKDGTASGALLNYNMLSGEMQFINTKGDTLAMANEGAIKCVAIGNDSFFYDKAFLQQIAGNSTAKLAKKESLIIGDSRKAGGYGGVSSTSAITTISNMRVNGEATHLTVQQEVTLTKETTYFIGDAYNHFLPATRKNLIKLFGTKQSAIEQYLKDNKVAFNKEEDLKALIAFLQQ